MPLEVCGYEYGVDQQPSGKDIFNHMQVSAIPLLCLQGVPDLPGAPQDEAGLTRKFVGGTTC